VAITAFKKVHLVAHRSVQDALLSALHRLGVVDLTASAALPPIAAAETPELRDAGTRLRRLDEALRRLARHLPPASVRERLAGERPRYTEAGLSALEHGLDLDGFLAESAGSEARLGELRAAAAKLDEERRLLEPWIGVDAPLELLRPTRQTAVATGRVRHADLACFRSEVAAAGAVRLRGGEDQRHRYKVVLFHRADEQAVRETLERTGFQPVDLPLIAVTPAERLAQIAAERHALRDAARAEEERAAGLSTRHGQLLALRDLLAGRLERLRAERLFGETRETVSIEGWVPAQLLEATRTAVTGRFALVSFEAYDPSPADRVPVLLSNVALVRPFESVVELYGLPRYGGIDPTSVLGFFFALCFGVCLTDAGYGILLAIAAGAAMAYTPPASFPARRRLLALFFLGGLATIVVGAAAGGWFGFPVRWRLFDPLQQIKLFFALAVLLGTAHLFAGLTLRIVHQVRRGKVLAPLLDQGLWMTLIAPLLGLLGVASGALPAALKPGLAFAALASALGIVFFQGRREPQAPHEPARERLHHLAWGGLALSLALHLLGHARPWSGFAAVALALAEVALLRGRVLGALGRVGLGLYSLYGISGYLSDILSYSRLVALGLGSGTVAMVVNTMASQALAMPVVGFLAAALIFTVGHLFNLAINLLGAFVHSCRLQYVEFFTKFYESGGRAYTPFRMAPKHVTIVDEARGG